MIAFISPPPQKKASIEIVVDTKKLCECTIGRVKVENQKVEVVKGPHGETITIHVRSTTEHESTLSGIVTLSSPYTYIMLLTT